MCQDLDLMCEIYLYDHEYYSVKESLSKLSRLSDAGSGDYRILIPYKISRSMERIQRRFNGNRVFNFQKLVA